MRNPACELLGCRFPIVLAGMGGVSRSELVAAVSAAGGFGFLGMVREAPELIVGEVKRLRRLGHQRFGVNIIPAATDPALLEQQVAACIRHAVPVVGTFWDLDERLTDRLHHAGILVVHQVGSVDEAIAAERAGVEIIIAQGREAGGHVRGVRPLHELLPEVVDAVKVPVLAAGGIVSGSDLVTATALGAAGIVLGTAMIATHESFAHSYHKQRLLAAEADNTLLTTTFNINWPPGARVRVLNSATTCGARGNAHTVASTVIGAEGGRPVYLFSTDSPLRSMTGDYESMALYAGTGVGCVTEIVPAGERMRTILVEAEEWLALRSEPAEVEETSSPVCYAGEMSGTYMGLLDDDELSLELWLLVDDMQSALRVSLSCHARAIPTPPFALDATEFACWLLRLQQLAGTLGRRVGHSARVASQLRPLKVDSALLVAALLGRLAAITPRMAEGRARSQLVLLAEFLEAVQLAAIRARPDLPSPAMRLNEAHGASGQ